jgi:hypothetical protein
MLRFVTVFYICLTAIAAYPQSASKWQVGTITEVKTHQTAEKVRASDDATYDVSVKVGDTIYVVLYTPPLHEDTVKYVAGRELLVFVGKSTIQYNDMLGQSHDVPIESQRPAANPSGSKADSHGAQ